MEIFTASALLLVVGLLTWLLIREKSQAAKQLRQQADSALEVQARQLNIIEKAFAQLRASDPWQYQSIQAVAQPLYDEVYDPSPEADAKRIAERNNTVDEQEEALSAEESAALRDLGFPGF